jgi:hypothetical protein
MNLGTFKFKCSLKSFPFCLKIFFLFDQFPLLCFFRERRCRRLLWNVWRMNQKWQITQRGSLTIQPNNKKLNGITPQEKERGEREGEIEGEKERESGKRERERKERKTRIKEERIKRMRVSKWRERSRSNTVDEIVMGRGEGRSNEMTIAEAKN